MKSDIEKWKKRVSDRPINCKDYFINSDDDAELIIPSFNMNKVSYISYYWISS